MAGHLAFSLSIEERSLLLGHPVALLREKRDSSPFLLPWAASASTRLSPWVFTALWAPMGRSKGAHCRIPTLPAAWSRHLCPHLCPELPPVHPSAFPWPLSSWRIVGGVNRDSQCVSSQQGGPVLTTLPLPLLSRRLHSALRTPSSIKER